ncbi:hypothetical protein HK100_002067 [Physocladia obscura]|uniref:G protein-coupled receptor n=1 Tax=Physocladia obscura TaxID=109957 RepID=A0AAD5SVX4_9FUNG|nr:hypothetical protein HK100_002067 [Physocladia obscura]
MGHTASNAVQLTLYLLGLLLNGLVLFFMSRKHRQLLSNLLNKRVAALILVLFIWSLTRLIVTSMILQSAYVSTNAVALVGNLTVLVLLLFNANLAAERFFIVQPIGKERYFFTIYSIFAALALVILIEFLIWPSTDQSRPSSSTGQIIWILSSSITFAGSTLLTGYFYMATYSFTSKQFAYNPRLVMFFMNDEDLLDDGSIDPSLVTLARRKVEGKVFRQCVFLSGSIIICYFPFWIYNIIYVVNGGVVPGDTGDGWSAVLIMLSMDVLITPLQILYFKSDIRETLMFWKK